MTDREAMQQALEALEAKGDAWITLERKARTALRERLAQPEPDFYGYASRLAVAIWEQHYKDVAPQWKPLDDLIGVLIQIDNMTAGLTRLAQPEQHWIDELAKVPDHVWAQPEQEPVAKVELMTTGGNAGLATRIVEIDDHLRERLRPGQLLYTGPLQRKPDHIGGANKMVPFQELAAELFVVAQISPADDGFSDTVTRIEAWLRNHFSTPPQRKPLPTSEVERLIYEHTKINPNVADDRELLGYIVNAARAIEAAYGIKGEA